MIYKFKSSSLASVAMLLLVILSGCFVQLNQASGIFELSLTSLVDSLGRDLRDDCCNWQNQSQQQQQQQQQQQHQHHHHQHHQLTTLHNQASQQQQALCDPSKCQLIIRICVKNYQTQIEASQCTFGELSAQVLKQSEQQLQQQLLQPHLNNIAPGNQYHSLLMGTGNSRQQQQQAGGSGARSPRVAATATPMMTNIHYQRMLSQTQFQTPLYYHQQQQQHQPQHQSASRQQQQQQLRSSLSGQPRALRTVAFHQPISFPFNFTWPGSFSLIIDAWFESPLQQVAPREGSSGGGQPTTTYDLYKRQLIIKHSMRGWLAVKNEWTNDVHKTDSASLAYSYRVTCQTNYFGDQCNILCRPRDDFYGHYTCSQQGNIVCLPGWQGSYCLEPICSPGCHKDQGNCSRPNECNCRFGWQGPACEQCVRYPGCQHGTCARPHECTCDEGWGGLLCNEDLNFCANHQPCKNDAICTNTFDSNGVGSYTCTCAPGFAGKNCERRAPIQEAATGQDVDPFADGVSAAAANVTLAAAAAPVAAVATPTAAATSILAPSSNQQVAQANIEQQLQQQQPPPVAASIKPKQQQQQQQPRQISGQQAQKFGQLAHQFPFAPAAAATNPAGASSQALDSAVVIAYGVIMVCIILLVLVVSFRTFVERASSMRGQWGQHRPGGHAEDVATLQNQQNLCKSRTSLAAATMLAGGQHDKHSPPYDMLDGAGQPIYAGSGRQVGTSGRQQQPQPPPFADHQNNGAGDSQTTPRSGKKSHHYHHYQSQHSLHATQQQQQQQQQQQRRHQQHQRGRHNQDEDGSSTASSSEAPPLPPPPYTIAQSTHSYPNLAYNNSSLNSLYSPAASAHYLPLGGASQAAREQQQQQQQQQPAYQAPTAISNAIYGSYSTYADAFAAAAAATAAAAASAAGPSATGPSGSGLAAAAAAAAATGGHQAANNANSSGSGNNQPYYVIYPIRFMPS